MLPTKSYTPSHPELFVVQFKPGDFSSSLISQKSFKEGETIAPLEGLTKGPKAYSSVQCGPNPDDHIELNSDLLYVNHSCEPNVAFDLSSSNSAEWHVRALKPIQKGDTLTFFYPSTEWDMQQPFDCLCGFPTCLRTIKGAAYLTADQLLARGFVSPWIMTKVRARTSGSSRSSTTVPAATEF